MALSHRLAKWIRSALAEEFQHLHSRVDRLSARLEARSDEALEKLSPNFPLTDAGYRDFWDAQASTRAGAATGVIGRPFGLEAWDELAQLHGKPVAETILRRLEIGPQHDVLELGVGFGRLASHIAPRCGSFVGADISARVLADAQRRWGDLNGKARWHPLEKPYLGDFQDESFDRVYFHVVLVHLDREDVYNYIQQTVRCLKPGGWAWFQQYDLESPGGWDGFLESARQAAESGGKSRGRMQFSTAGELRRMVEKAGLIIDEGRSRLSPEAQPDAVPEEPVDWGAYRKELESILTEKLGASEKVGEALAHFDANRLPGAPDKEWAHYLIAVARKPSD